MENWPITPQWLSIVEGKSERDAQINNDGIFLHDTLRGFIADASSYKEINNPLSIFQVVNESSKFEGEEDGIIKRVDISDKYISDQILKCQNKRVIRIDSGSLFPNLECCDKFRDCKGHELCYDIDGRIAILFHPSLPGIHKPEYAKKLEEILVEYNNFHHIEGFYAVKVQRVTVEIQGKNVERFYLWYTCPYSNLDEYFFPVIYNNRPIAVVMQGQRPNSVLKKENVFKKYLVDSEALRASIKELDSHFSKESLSEGRMKTIFSRIHRLEEMISDAVAAKAQKYVSNIIKEVEDTYTDKLHQINIINNNNAFDEVKSSIGEALASISEKFSDCYFISIFSEKKEIETIDSSFTEFELIASSNPTYKTVLLQFKKDLPYTTIEDEELKKYMINPSIVHNNDIFRMIVQLGNGIRYIIWKRYGNWKEDYPEQYEIYKKRVIAIYSNLLEPYYILKSTMLEKQLENSMRFTSHESAQIIPLVINSIKDEYTQDIIENRVDYTQQYIMKIPSYVVVDSIYRLMLLGKLLKTPSLIFKDTASLKNNIKNEWVDIHRMVYSSKSLFDKKAATDKFQEIYVDLEPSLRSKSILIDYNYMSHILFNLVDNAIKYGIKGSRIIITVKETTEDYSKKIKISIVNYSKSPIGDKKIIFNLYYRGNQAHIIEGTGMGLFVVRKLSSLLGLKVECTESKLIVKGLNLPYIYHYKKRHNNNYSSLTNVTLDKLNKNIESTIIDEIVNKKIYTWEIGLREIQNNIDIDIYKNEFVVTIPINDNNIKSN